MDCSNILFSLLFFIFQSAVYSRSHQLILNSDSRNFFRISTFGYLSGGKLEVQMNYLTFYAKYSPKVGFTITKTPSESINPYLESLSNRCFLADDSRTLDGNVQILSFLLDFKDNQLMVNCSSLLPFLEIKSGVEMNLTLPDKSAKRDTSHQISVQNMIKQKRSLTDEQVKEHDKAVSVNASEVSESKENSPDKSSAPLLSSEKSESHAKSSFGDANYCNSFKLPFKSEISGQRRKITDVKFVIYMKGENSAGLYSLYFHNCAENDELRLPVNLSISLVEHNGKNYLSAGEMPLPHLYFLMSLVFLISGIVWISVLKKKKEETFKIHYLMGVLVFLKSLSLLFHGINYQIIGVEGTPMEAWAVLFYITHLLKGGLLFITIVLIGTGWAFIKHILSDKDKKIFMIVIPLQVLSNVAKIIMEESEEGQSQHYTWREIFILVDLICCGAIMFPVVWSIRHLQEASQTDGKAAINLEKLKLFRQFYVMIVCYIYFTRIIVYLLKITVPFQYEWLDELFKEGATFAFFVMTGINFQPTASNPYFRLSQDDDLEMDEVITQTGFTEHVTKTVRSRDTTTEESTATKRESSHEYD